jgi:DNA-binding NarL/FixJ family response regulator
MIRVFLVCDDPEFCEKLGSFFTRQDNFEVCGKTQRTVAAVQKADQLLPDMAILVLDSIHDFKIADDFKKSMPHLPLFLITTAPSVEIEKKALSCGVDAVFSVDDELITLALNARVICPVNRFLSS